MSRLQEYCINITDGEHGGVIDDSSSKFVLLNNNNITTDGIVINDTDRRISKESFEKIQKRIKLEKQDLVIATCGTIGKNIVIDDDEINYVFSRSVGIIKCNKELLLPEYLHYYLDTPLSQKKIQNVSKGGVQKHFYISDMMDFDIVVPSIQEQKKKIKLLIAIDSKIQNDNKIISKLNSLENLIYDYYFLAPYYNETTSINKVERHILSDYVDVVTGKEDANHSTSNGKYPFFTCSNEILKCDDYKFEGKSILLAGNGDFNIKYYSGRYNAYQRTYALIPKEEKYVGVIYHGVKTAIDLLKKSASGSIVKFITKSSVENIPVLLSDNRYMELLNNVLNMKNEINMEIEKLKNIKELLLSKFI